MTVKTKQEGGTAFGVKQLGGFTGSQKRNYQLADLWENTIQQMWAVMKYKYTCRIFKNLYNDDAVVHADSLMCNTASKLAKNKIEIFFLFNSRNIVVHCWVQETRHSWFQNIQSNEQNKKNKSRVNQSVSSTLCSIDLLITVHLIIFTTWAVLKALVQYVVRNKTCIYAGIQCKICTLMKLIPKHWATIKKFLFTKVVRNW